MAKRSRAPVILIVDDDPDFANAVGDSLECEGYRVLVATTIETARKCLVAKPQLVLLDLMMRNEPSLSLAAELSHVPIVIVSGFPRAAGHDGTWIEKPVQLEVLLDLVARHVPLYGSAEGTTEDAARF